MINLNSKFFLTTQIKLNFYKNFWLKVVVCYTNQKSLNVSFVNKIKLSKKNTNAKVITLVSNILYYLPF